MTLKPGEAEQGVPPSVDCPTCHAYICVTDDCWACGRVFRPRELWERYETQQAVRAHYR